MNRQPLVVALKSIIERTYGMPLVIEDLSPFLIGDRGLAALYGGWAEHETGTTPGARVLVRETGPSLRLALYYPDTLVHHLERYDPLVELGDVNIDAFAVLVEELDHLLTLASRAVEGRQVSLLELEHHANVTKYLAVLHLLGKQSGRRRLPDALRLWVRHHLFEKYAQGPAECESRYRHAAALAVRYLCFLESMPTGERWTELRTFQQRPFSDTFRLLVNRN